MATTPVTKEQVEKRIIDALVEFGADPDEMHPDKTLAVFLTYLGKKENCGGRPGNGTAAYAQFRQSTAIYKMLPRRKLSWRDSRTRCGFHRRLMYAVG